MIETEKRIVYQAFGLNILSEVPLKELTKVDILKNPVDIVIERADLSELWSELSLNNKKMVVQENLFVFELPNVAIFCIKDGNKIIVSPMDNSDEDQIRLYILGTCMGALLLQRKVLPLHGSAVVIDGKAYAFIGESGAGKSTLASAFLERGYQLLTDDVIAITSNEPIPMVTPSYPQQKLWQESLEQFGMDASQYRPLFQRQTKYSIPVISKFSTEPIPLAAVFELIKTDPSTMELKPIIKLDRLRTLYTHTYRHFLVQRFGLLEWHFNTCTDIVNHIDLYRLSRPSNEFTAPKLVTLILETIKKEREKCQLSKVSL